MAVDPEPVSAREVGLLGGVVSVNVVDAVATTLYRPNESFAKMEYLYVPDERFESACVVPVLPETTKSPSVADVGKELVPRLIVTDMESEELVQDKFTADPDDAENEVGRSGP